MRSSVAAIAASKSFNFCHFGRAFRLLISIVTASVPEGSNHSNRSVHGSASSLSHSSSMFKHRLIQHLLLPGMALLTGELEELKTCSVGWVYSCQPTTA